MTSNLNQPMSLLEMITILSGGTFAAVGNLSQSSDMLYRAVESEPLDGIGIHAEMCETLRISIEEVARIAKEAHLDATAEMARSNLELLGRGYWNDDGFVMRKADAERLCWGLNTLSRTLSAQLQSRLVVVFDSKNSQYMVSDEPPFGREVADAFVKSSEEILEAAKCLALRRNTACVFHLMRAMEIAVARLAESIPTGKPTDKEWGKILSDIGAAIEAMPKGADRKHWSESHSLLYHVKESWRNETMHPKKTYTDEQAQAVFDAVKSFMVHLAPLVR